MTFLPLIERELRLRARSPAAYWTRFAVAAAGVVICLPQLTSSVPFGTPASVGKGVFNGLVCAAFLLTCGVCLLTADALNAEQREGTLGLLLLTRVRVLDVLLGKLGSIGITSVCVLVAFLPMLMLPVLSGGVTAGEVFRKELALLIVLLFALATGLFASACQRERFKATCLAVLIVAGLALGPYWLGLMFGAGPGGVLPKASLPSPVVLLTSAGDLLYGKSTASYWTSMAIVSTLSWVLLIGAGVQLRRGLRGEGETVAARRKAPTRAAERAPQPRRRPRFAAEANPIAWRVSGQRGLRATVWAAALLGLPYYWVFAVIARAAGPGLVAGVSWSLGLATSAIVGSLIAWAASRFFVESRRTGELELLLTTPVGAHTIVSDQWKVLKRLLRWPLVLMLAPMVIQMVYILVLPRGFPGLWRVYYVVSLPLGVLNTILGLAALCWLALWFGLRAGGQAKAILWSVILGKALPYGINLVAYAFRGAVGVPRTGFPSTWYWAITSWLPSLTLVLFFLWAIRFARSRLLRDLAAAQPLAARFAPTCLIRRAGCRVGIPQGPALDSVVSTSLRSP